MGGVADMEGVGPETGGKGFDPMGFSKIASEETLAWYRAAELKHSRVAMAAVTGWAYVSSGAPLFPGFLSIQEGVTFESLGRDGYAAWDAVPDNGKAQIIGVIGILELLGEASVKPHYMAGGTPGKIPLLWDPLGFTARLSPETLARKRLAELKNGRLAMIGVMSSSRRTSSRILSPCCPKSREQNELAQTHTACAFDFYEYSHRKVTIG